MRIWTQKSASIQKRTSPLKFDNSAEKSEKDTVSYLSTKRAPRKRTRPPAERRAAAWSGRFDGLLPAALAGSPARLRRARGAEKPAARGAPSADLSKSV